MHRELCVKDNIIRTEDFRELVDFADSYIIDGVSLPLDVAKYTKDFLDPETTFIQCAGVDNLQTKNINYAVSLGFTNLDIHLNNFLLLNNNAVEIEKYFKRLIGVCNRNNANVRAVIEYRALPNMDDLLPLLGDYFNTVVLGTGYVVDDCYDSMIYAEILNNDYGVQSIICGIQTQEQCEIARKNKIFGCRFFSINIAKTLFSPAV